MELVKKMRKIKFNNNSQDLENKNNTIKEEDENENDNYNINNLKSNRTKLDETLINSDKINILIHEISLHQLPRCTHIYCKLLNDITEDDSLNKCLEILEDISKNVYKLGLCNCIKEKNKISSTSINLLSCLIPKDKIDNYNIERMGGNFNNFNNSQNNEDNNDISKTIKSKTFFDSGKANYFSLINHPSKMNKKELERKQTIINKKIKKKVKFVDEVYNKSLIEEIQIKSYKGYNVKNNCIYGEDNNNYKNDKKVSCCLLI